MRKIAQLVRDFPGARPLRPIRCGKTAYPDRAAAQYALIVLALSGEPRDRMPVRAYECPACGDWHLTSRPAPPADI
ncbi:MAG: hypothetical protein ACRDVE_21040 [Actinocrinis sp.]